MKHKKIISLSLTSLMSFSLVGCGATLEEYKKYAEAGQAYSIAMQWTACLQPLLSILLIKTQ